MDRLADERSTGEVIEHSDECGFADLQHVAECDRGLRSRNEAKSFEDSAGKWIVARLCAWRAVDDNEMRGGFGLKSNANRCRSRRCAVFDGEETIVAVSRDVNGGIGPRAEVAATAELLSEMCGGSFSHVMNEKNGDVEATLDFTKVAENRRNLCSRIFVDGPHETDEGIEDEKPWFHVSDGGAKGSELSSIIEV